ncbi:MAG: LysR family transcriptional regulator [Oscillospiraceae bacterium]|nr:LysR family transcriptional regulator [Oscillospiraceae bacterium]
MNIRQLEYFVAIAESGTISAAARKLKISQPPLSAQLRLLEEETGTLLVERGPRRLQLTEAGKLLYQRAGTMISLAEATMRELRDFEDGAGGTLQLGTISSCGAVLLERCLPGFQKKFPKASFELREGNTYEMLEMLRSGVIEAAVVRTPFPEDGLECVYLEEEPMIAAGKKGSFSKDVSEKILLRELEQFPLIYYRRMEKLLEEAFRREGLRPKVFCKNDDARTSLMWARAGMGTALVPASIFRAMDRGEMEYREVEAPELVTRIAVVRRKDSYSSVLTEGLFRAFQEEHR